MTTNDKSIAGQLNALQKRAAEAEDALDEARVEIARLTAAERFDFAVHLARQKTWSSHTFGPGSRTTGILDHIRKELREIEAQPNDLSEWIDVVILALDGAWRIGHSPEQIIAALVAKQTKNEVRVWPNWRTAPAGKAIEHRRDDE